ncbi:putative alcohol oxidase [Xylogone sp. PMI_703]|nr:putative alcohol oxidase [Xylogone sp. PMI_703]
MSTYNESVGDVDIIFAGGGTAACVTAGRLAKANPDLKILVVEAGKNNYNDPTVVNPAVYLTHLAPDSSTALFYKSKKSDYLAGREAIVPSGGILGGGSSINFMMYTRAQGIDFDSWNTPGWSAKDMLEMCKKLETYHPRGEGIDPNKHGYDGPIHVSDGGYRGTSEKEWMSTITKMGYKNILDLQDLDAIGGFSHWHRYVSPDGKRQDTAHRYIHPLMQDGKHPNLHLLVESKVVRVIFDESTPPRAIGIEYVPNPAFQPITSLSKPVHKIIKANKLVVVSSGALGTPQVLERSGVGNPELLKKLGIPVVADVPGVGENYQDHHLILYPYRTSLGERETLDGIFSGRADFARALEEKDPILGWNGIDLCSKLRPTDAEVAQLGPDFKKFWDKDFAPYPTRPLMLTAIVNAWLADPSLVKPGQYVNIGVYTAYPYSRGRIHITDKDNVTDGYDFDNGFLNHPADIKKQLWAYKITREIARRTNSYRGEVDLGHPHFRPGSKAALVDLTIPGEVMPSADEIKDIEYDVDDDAAIEQFIRENVNTTWHSIGTCAMREKDQGGVVDKDLNVYGTQALKLVDLSICPENVGANTNNTALAVGEKAAVIIGRELGIEV